MKKLIKKLNITKKEWKLVFLLTIIIAIITTIPYLYAHLQSTQNKIYNGLHTLTPGDMHVYFSYLEQIKQGNYLLKNLFTSEKTLPMFNVFWLTAGLFGKLFNLSNIFTFHITRILLIPPCIISLYLLISYLFNSKLARKTSLIFALFGSGLGAWASILIPSYINNKTLFYWPMDLWNPEYNFFLILYHSPHLIASITLMVLFFFLFLKSTEENNNKCSILAGLCGMTLIQFHPFHLPTIVLVPIFYVLAKWILKRVEHTIECSTPNHKLNLTTHHACWLVPPPAEGVRGRVFTSILPRGLREGLLKFLTNWQDLKHLIIAYTIISPSVLYYAWLIKFDWATKLKSLQNRCYTPTFFTVLISYGGLIIFSLIAIFLYIKHFHNKKYTIYNIQYQNMISKNKFLFMTIWAITQFTLIFMPFRFQRRLTEGLQIPLVILTVIAIIYLKEKFKNLDINKINLTAHCTFNKDIQPVPPPAAVRRQRLCRRREGVRGRVKVAILKFLCKKIFFNKFSLVLIFILVFTISNLFVLKEDIKYFSQKNELFYFDKQQIEAYEFLKNEASDEEITLSGIINGNAIPGITGKQVYFGHNNIETLYFDKKSTYLKWFFKNNTENEKKKKFLKENNIKYIYYSSHEKKLGNFEPKNKNYLEQIYTNNFAQIYKVKL